MAKELTRAQAALLANLRVQAQAVVSDKSHLIRLDLPPGWFLEILRDLRKPIIKMGDTHESTGIWQCYLQHELRSGHMTLGEGPTPQAAIDNAKAEIVKSNRSPS